MLDIVRFPDPVIKIINFLSENLGVDVSTELPKDYANAPHVLVFASASEVDLAVRQTRYVLECRADSDMAASELGSEVAAYVSAWCRSGLNPSPSGFSLISLVDSFPDFNSPRSIATVQVYWGAIY